MVAMPAARGKQAKRRSLDSAILIFRQLRLTIPDSL